MDIRELLRHIQANPSDRGVHRETGVHRLTVKRYRQWATEQDLLAGPLPPIEELQALLEATLPNPRPPQNVSSVEPYHDIVEKLHKEGVESAAIRERLRYSNVPPPLRGLGITFIVVGLMSVGFMAFAGIQL